LTICGFTVKASHEREFWTMRGLLMALFALDFPGHDGRLRANHWAGRLGAPILPHADSVTTTAKTTTKTTRKTV
jgi:hypothetical protein